MGINVYLENERGEALEKIYDPQNVIARLLPAESDENFPLLRYIDPYGDSVFNLLQIKEVIKELESLRSTKSKPEELEIGGHLLPPQKPSPKSARKILKAVGGTALFIFAGEDKSSPEPRVRIF